MHGSRKCFELSEGELGLLYEIKTNFVHKEEWLVPTKRTVVFQRKAKSLAIAGHLSGTLSILISAMLLNS